MSPSISQPPVDVPPSGQHHHIATSQNHPVAIFTLLREHDDDPALKVVVTSHFKCTLLKVIVSNLYQN